MPIETKQPPASQPPTRVILEQASPWGRWSTRLAWIIAGVAVLSAIGSAGAFSQYFQRDARVVEKYHSLSKIAGTKVAIVSVTAGLRSLDAGCAPASMPPLASNAGSGARAAPR